MNSDFFTVELKKSSHMIIQKYKTICIFFNVTAQNTLIYFQSLQEIYPIFDFRGGEILSSFDVFHLLKCNQTIFQLNEANSCYVHNYHYPSFRFKLLTVAFEREH